jgi:hypothetical protein
VSLRPLAVGEGAADRHATARPLFTPGVLRRMAARTGPLLAFYVAVIPAGVFRGVADNIGPAPRSDFSWPERIILFDWPTHLLQGSVLDTQALRVAATGIYCSWFFIPLSLALPLVLLRPQHYWRFVAFLAVVYYLGMPFFAAYPLEPPWLHDASIVRVVGEVIPTATGKDTNPYAAMPSLHVALPAAAALWFGWRSTWGRALLAYSALIGVTVVYSGDHYVADVLGGYALAVAATLLMRRLGVPLFLPAERPSQRDEPPLPLRRAA